MPLRNAIRILAFVVAGAAAAQVPAGAFPDAADVSGALVGADNAKGRDAIVVQANGADLLGYRSGRWKLVRVPPGRQRGYGGFRGPSGDALYDLDADPGETTDLRAQHPDVVARLATELDRVTAAR